MNNSTNPIVSTSTVPKRLDKYDIEKHFDEFVVVWLRESDLDSDVEFELRQLINYVKIFQHEEHCLEYIRSHAKEKIFLILSDLVAEKFVPKIHDLEQIQFIYIFCEYFLRYYISNSLVKVEKHREWTRNYLKIIDVFNDRSKLFLKLEENAKFLSLSTLPITIFRLTSDEKSIRELSKENARIMWFYLIIEVLLRMPDKSTSKAEMINECRLCYESDLIEQEKIKDFEENYSSDQAISWYTRDSFLFRILNKALRTENIDIIYKFRFFLTDLLNQIKFLHTEFIELLDDMILTVYRGGCIAINELENLKNNIGGLISFNTFLSTTLEKDVALLFAGQGDHRPLRESILFQIKIYAQENLKPFANIKEKSFMKDEDEILFSLGTIFRIESVECLDQYIWLVNLTLSGNEDEQLQTLRKYFQENLEQTSSINDLGDFLYKIGDYNRAENYYRMLLNKYPSDHRDLVMIYCNMGVLQHCQNNYREASDYFTTALLILANSLPFKTDRDHIDYATIDYNLACSVAKFQGYKKALSIFKRCLDRINKHIKTSSPLLINMYNGYALANADDGIFGMALFYHNVALSIAETSIPRNQLDLANTYHSMGLTCKLKKDYSQALDFFQKSIDIRQLCLPENHPDLADVFHNIAHIYYHQKHYELALETYEKVLEIYLKSHLMNYYCITMVYVDIGNVHRNIGNYQIANENYQLALEMADINPVEQYNYRAQVYMNMGLLYECQQLQSEALLYLEKAVSAVKATWSKDQLDLAVIYNHMGLIYYKNQNDQLAIDNFKKCLDIRLKFLNATHPNVLATYDNINQINESKETLADSSETSQIKGQKDSVLCSPNSDQCEVLIQQNIFTIVHSSDKIHEPLDLRVIKKSEN